MPALPLPDELANEFCRILNEWLPPETIDEINRRNSNSEYPDSCASHDFCDANQAMLDAMSVWGLDFEQDLIPLINEAWEIAKGRGFAPTFASNAQEGDLSVGGDA